MSTNLERTTEWAAALGPLIRCPCVDKPAPGIWGACAATQSGMTNALSLRGAKRRSNPHFGKGRLLPSTGQALRQNAASARSDTPCVIRRSASDACPAKERISLLAKLTEIPRSLPSLGIDKCVPPVAGGRGTCASSEKRVSYGSAQGRIGDGWMHDVALTTLGTLGVWDARTDSAWRGSAFSYAGSADCHHRHRTSV